MKKKTKIALRIILGVLILAFFTAEVVGLSIYKRDLQNKPHQIAFNENVIYIKIKNEYHDRFVSGEYANSDHGYWNVEKTEYDASLQYYTIHLKSHGILPVLEAKRYFEKFDFVNFIVVKPVGGTNKQGRDSL